jgi:hypothetical protein
MRLVRSSVLVSAKVLLASMCACGGSGGGDPRVCGSEGDCGPLARCVAATCVEDAAPVAVLVLPEAPQALALVEFDASASSDPDASLGDRVAAFHWTFTSLDDGCAAPAVTGTDAKARVRFGCGGAFRVSLVVVDEKGKESSPVSADLAVAPHSGSSILVPSADQTVNHVCSGTPRVCTTEGTGPVVTVQLAGGIEAVGTVAYHWTVDPPQSGPLDAHKRVTFTPSADVSNPVVHIEADESALAALVDDWILRVSAHDDAGPLGEATTRISVKNRPPVLVQPAPAVTVDHTFSGGSYRASADASRWQDPDGDPLAMAEPTGSTVCPDVSFKADGTALIQCTRTFSGTLALGGFVGTHSVTVRASDPWTSATSPSATAITINNQPPTANDTLTVAPDTCEDVAPCCAHEASACIAWTRACSATTIHPHPAISDPDGDPVAVAWFGGDWTPGTQVCLPADCTAEGTIPEFHACSGPGETGSRTGTYSVTDGLATTPMRTLTTSWYYY